MKGFIDIDNPQLPNPDPRAVLDHEKQKPNRVLCFVFGSGAEADAVQDTAAAVAGKNLCAAVRVLRVRNDAVLRPDESEWKHGTGTGLTLLRFNQNDVSRKMTLAEASDEGDLFNAMLDALAGKKS